MLTKAEINLIRSLKNKTARTETGLFVCEGEKLVKEIVASPFEVRHIYTTRNDLTKYGPGAEKISVNEMKRISHLKTPAEVLATIEIPSWKDPGPGGLALALDGIQDPGNLGTIIRLADWFGIGKIYCSPESADCFNPKVVQATMGSIARVKIFYRNLADLIKNSKLPVYGTFLEGENMYQMNLSNEGYIVMGSEGRGISDSVAALISHRIFIPSYPEDSRTSESLNVAVAAALVCAEFRRPRR